MSSGLDYHFSNKPFTKSEPCADFGYFKETKDSLFFAIADVAGHGKNAHELSLIIKKYFSKTLKKDLPKLMTGLHTFLRGSRGAVAGAGLVHKKTGAVEYVGLGNISVRKFGKKDFRFISKEGILGYIIPTPKMERAKLSVQDVMVLYTDGIRDHFERNDCPKDFFNKKAKHIVNGIIENFYKGNDDAGCIAIRYKND